MAELVSPCCGAEYTDDFEPVSSCCTAIPITETDLCSDCLEHSDFPDYQCSNCDELFDEPEKNYEYDDRMKDSIAEDRMDEARDMGE